MRWIILSSALFTLVCGLMAQQPEPVHPPPEQQEPQTGEPPSEQQEPDLVTITDTSYFTPGDNDWNLVESVIREDAANVLLLLSRGADPDASAEGGMTALMYAAELGNLLITKILVLNGADVGLTHVENTTPLLVAVLNQHFEVARFLLESGADPDHVDDYGGSPLIYAAAVNDYRIADLLLFYGASDTIRDRYGNGAVMTATWFGNIETVDVLLQNELDPDLPDRKGNTPLMIAAQQGQADIVNLLLEYDAEMERTNRQNYTPLAHAIRFHRDTVAGILIDSGANVHHRIGPGLNLYDLAVQENQKEIRRMLKEKGAGPLPRPSFSELKVVWGNSLAGGEYMMQNRVSLVDNKFGFYAETGFDFRPSPRKVLVSAADTLLYQYREHRPAWTLGVGKSWKMATDHFGMEYGLYTGLYGVISFPRYRGFREKPPLDLTLMPAAGVYMQGKIAGFRAGVERYRFGTLDEGAWKINLTLFVRIKYRSQDAIEKEIYY